ncbi:hypothetical protein JXJ21_26100 [candidate division KSB1 bacterium]|nr:hypothetical protein [candidate division KSB1 bacterium]
MSLLGIDIGTSGCKAAAFNAEGACLASASREYASIHAHAHRAELDSQFVWNCIKEIIALVAQQTAADPIEALCVSTMGEAATPVTRNRCIIGNCILSSDTRGIEFIDQLRQRIDQESFYRINPNILGPNYTLPKLLWLREHEPERFNRTYKFLLWDGLVGFLAGTEPFISFSNANRTLLFDIQRETWSDHLLSLVDLDPQLLPRCLPGGTIAGGVSRRIADELGLPLDVKIIVGGHDQCCNALGAGIAQPGRAVDGIGTFECITPVYAKLPAPHFMLEHGLNIEHHVLPGLYVSFLYNQGGSLIRWFRDTFAFEMRNNSNIYEQLTEEMPSEPTRLFVLPYFEMTGPPAFVSDASGVIIGLKTTTRRSEILKAIMESVTFYFFQSLRALNEIGIDTSEFVATGGGAKSDAWLQIKADILGVPFKRTRYTECGLVGAAILAGVATGAFNHAEDGIACLVREDRTFEPDPRRHEIYQSRIERYQRLFPLLRGFLSSNEA